MDIVEDDIEIKIEKPSRAERWKRSVTARLRRQAAKFAKTSHVHKDEDDALDRMQAKHTLEKQKKQKRNKKSLDHNKDH